MSESVHTCMYSTLVIAVVQTREKHKWQQNEKKKKEWRKKKKRGGKERYGSLNSNPYHRLLCLPPRDTQISFQFQDFIGPHSSLSYLPLADLENYSNEGETLSDKDPQMFF